ncbi:MAG: IMP cyclohydrolase [Nitrospirae bacterium]|nr:IMP cyclohydrolase [Nitrospirota bacterium]
MASTGNTKHNAIISVSDKTGVIEFAGGLVELGLRVLSTGGTAKALRKAGVPVTEVSEYTGFPEMMDGRVKTLHPKIHGGILARRDNAKDMESLSTHDIERIDLVAVNLYPFEQTVAKEGVTFGEAIENIDIGGPTLLRAAAKNFWDVTAIVDPSDYEKVLGEMREYGQVSGELRLALAEKVFATTSRYDKAISTYLSNVINDGVNG